MLTYRNVSDTKGSRHLLAYNDGSMICKSYLRSPMISEIFTYHVQLKFICRHLIYIKYDMIAINLRKIVAF